MFMSQVSRWNDNNVLLSSSLSEQDRNIPVQITFSNNIFEGVMCPEQPPAELTPNINEAGESQA